MQHIESSPKFSKLAVYPLLLPSEHIAPLDAELIEVPPENTHQFTCLHGHLGVKITVTYSRETSA